MTPIQQFRTSARWSSLGILPSYLSCIRSANLRRTPEQRQGPGRGLHMVRPIIWSSSSGSFARYHFEPFYEIRSFDPIRRAKLIAADGLQLSFSSDRRKGTWEGDFALRFPVLKLNSFPIQFQIVLSTLAIAVQSMVQSESAESTLFNGSINDEEVRHWRNSVQKCFLELLRMGCC
jgi:hypothetical protein